MLIIITLLIALAGIAETGAAGQKGSGPDLRRLSISQLEARLSEIDSELETLASCSLRSGTGSVGFRSESHAEPDHPEWIQVNLEREALIDRVVLVPTIWRDTRAGFKADGFPVAFRLVADTGASARTLATYRSADRLLPRIAPLVISFPPVKASRVRLEATTLSPRAWDNRYLLQLAEILVFEGQENVALRQPVEVSSASDLGKDPPRLKESVVDGFMPYLMDAAGDQQSISFVSQVGVGDQPSMTLDLGSALPLNRIHLHAVELSDTVPQTTPSDFLIPKRLLAEGANRPDFSDAVLLAEYDHQTTFDTGPIMMRRFTETRCRYVRLNAVEPFIDTLFPPGGSKIGFAEIEIFSNGRNVAKGLPVEINFEQLSPDRTLSALTDGCNLYGPILPIREWMEQLGRRHDLETERPFITGELTERYRRQKALLQGLAWLAALLGAGIVITVLIEKVFRQRAVFKTRERIAANLHDELGANLHAIGMLGDMAKEEAGASDRLTEIVDRIRALTDRTGSAARYCANMLEADDLCSDLTEEMKRSSYRLLADAEHEITFEGEEFLQGLSPHKRIDLFLFYKESLTNIIRHSSATRVTTHLKAEPNRISLEITDNGIGFSAGSNHVPSSLKRRARLLGAQLGVSSIKDGGTRITLHLKLRKNRRTR